MGGWGDYARYEAMNPRSQDKMELPETLSKTKTRKLNGVIREYSKRLGLNDPGARFSARQHIIRVCNKFPRIRAYVRPLGGKVTEEHSARFFAFMVENPIGDFVVSADLASPKPPKDNKKVERRVLTKARKAEAAKRAKFYETWEWKKLRYQILQKYGARCMVCNAQRTDFDLDGKPVRIVVDHIKPLAKHWELRLEPGNLQVLCHDCNKGKGAWDDTDHRLGQQVV
ncbi:HNH endonuclease [Mesorhizobium sp. M2D.F.Ca.ET.185.01.1.1]|nr:HNH endonuclease [Mesorhizobium sp. M2D.F.Ca.ET.206.01.1.1]TGS32595.1 HNH endonuclease [Mesorhizobium sp. M2D.F.Ca.ET.185.01.1.1]TGU23685.1 HNH endonuclease [Mesorhizobium sp. M2D.F.Ca.ET.153.01.1.1]TGV73546.1 HNH endonuclease [Mesorhizobium sp. M00.F.Ca.ET.149.01.1.1]